MVSTFDLYVAAFYWAAMTVSTVGTLGHVGPTRTPGPRPPDPKRSDHIRRDPFRSDSIGCDDTRLGAILFDQMRFTAAGAGYGDIRFNLIGSESI